MPEQPGYPPGCPPGGTTTASPRVLEKDNLSPPRVSPLVPTDNVLSPSALYQQKSPPQIVITNKINQRIMEELKNNQPFHQHNHDKHLETGRVTRFTHSGVKKTSYRSKHAQYLKSHDRTIIEMNNAVTYPLTGYQMEYGDLIKEPKLWEIWTTSMTKKLGRLYQGVGERMPTEAPKRKFKILCKNCM